MSTAKENTDTKKATEGKKSTEPCAVIHCPPLKTSSKDFVGLSIKKVREALGTQLEIPGSSPVSVSKDGGKHYEKVNDEYVINDQDHVEFGRSSSRKGDLKKLNVLLQKLGRKYGVSRARSMEYLNELFTRPR